MQINSTVPLQAELPNLPEAKVEQNNVIAETQPESAIANNVEESDHEQLVPFGIDDVLTYEVFRLGIRNGGVIRIPFFSSLCS